MDKLLFSKNYEKNFKVINNGGWHFTWLGNLEFIKNKLKSFAHTELDTPSVNNDDYIKRCIDSLEPIENKNQIKLNKLVIDEINLPSYIVKNINKYRGLLEID